MGLEKLFQFATRDEKAIKVLKDRLAAIKRAPFPDRRLRGHEPKLPPALLDETGAKLAALLSLAPEFDFPCEEEWDSARWKARSAALANNVQRLRRWAWDSRSASSAEGSGSEQDIEVILNDLRKIGDVIEEFELWSVGDLVAAEHDRAALIEGRAGTGKSHLLGRIAELAADEGRPIILLLGQRLGDQPLWTQVTKRLGLENLPPDEFLQALDAAAASTRKRGIILVDAINEGAGARLWKPELAEFLARVRRFPNLICIIACRTEYVPYVFPAGVLAALQRFTIRGFMSPLMSNLRRREYLDKRGISRPSTPWIAPEFVNPLFLRSTCLALSREKKSEFPRGLHGTKEVLSFYLKSVARNLGVGRDGSDELVPATVAAIRAIAARMAANRADYVSLTEAKDITDANFSAFPLPIDQTWLDVLHRNGLLRNDPDPTTDTSDPLVIAPDVVQFSFPAISRPPYGRDLA